MKLKSDIRIKQIGDESILVSYDGGNINYTRAIALNPSAEFLLRQAIGENTIDPIVWRDRLMAKYGIDPQQALDDVEALIGKLKEAGVVI